MGGFVIVFAATLTFGIRFCRAFADGPSFPTDGLWCARVLLRGEGRIDPGARSVTYERIVRSLTEVGWIDSVALCNTLPGLPAAGGTTIGLSPVAPTQVRASLNLVSPSYFSILRLPLIEGRGFSTDDQPNPAQAVGVLTEAAAQELPVGRLLETSVYVGPRRVPIRIVGVVAAVHRSRADPADDAALYLMLGQAAPPGAAVIFKTGFPRSAVPPAFSAVTEVLKPVANFTRAMPLDDRIHIRRFGSAGIALVCACVAMIIYRAIRSIADYRPRPQARQLHGGFSFRASHLAGAAFATFALSILPVDLAVARPADIPCAVFISAAVATRVGRQLAVEEQG